MSPPPVSLRPEALAPYEQLQQALAQLAEQGRATPCQRQPDAWVSEDPPTRAEAAEACRQGCPLLELCARYADAQREAFGCWGGRDRTPTTRGDTSD